MKVFSFFLLILLMACSSAKKNTNETEAKKEIAPSTTEARSDLNPYQQYWVGKEEKRKACFIYRSEVLEEAVWDDPVAEEKNEDPIRFVEDEAKAITFLKRFDMSKTMEKESYEAYEIFLKSNLNPNPEALRIDPPECDTLFSNYYFFKGLIWAMGHNKWSKSTKELGLKTTLDYLQSISIPKVSMIYILTGHDLITRLAEEKLVKLSPKTAKKWQDEAEASYQKFNKTEKEISNGPNPDRLKSWEREQAVIAKLSKNLKEKVQSLKKSI